MSPSPSCEYWKGRLLNMERTFSEPAFVNASADEIRQYRELMETYFLNFATAHAEAIQTRSDVDSVAAAETNYREVEAIYIRLGAVIVQRLNSMEQRSAPSAGTATRPPAEIAAEVGIFRGEANEWAAFFARYTRLVQSNMRLDSCEKLAILRSVVRGHAVDLIRQRETDENPYEAAWQRLCQLYQDVHALRRMYFTRLETIAVLREPSAIGLHQLMEQVNASMDRLRELGVNVNAAPQMFVHLLEQRLDPTTARIWNSRRGQAVPTFQNLCEFITARARELSQVEPRSSRSNEAPPSRHEEAPQPAARRSNNANARSRPSSRPERTSAIWKVCIRCSGGHRLIRCPQFLHMSPTERRMRVREWGLCEHCLVPTHTTQMCRAGNCRNCNGTSHNSLLCPEVERREALQQASRRAEAQARANANASANNSASASPNQPLQNAVPGGNSAKERIARLPKPMETLRSLHRSTQIELGRSPSPLNEWVEQSQLNPAMAPYMPPAQSKAHVLEEQTKTMTPVRSQEAQPELQEASTSQVGDTDYPMVELPPDVGADILTQALQCSMQSEQEANAPSSSQLIEIVESMVQAMESGQQAVPAAPEVHSANEPQSQQQMNNANDVQARAGETPSVSLPNNCYTPTPRPPAQLMDLEVQIDSVEPSDLGEEMEKMILTGGSEAPASDEETMHSDVSTGSTTSTSEVHSIDEPASNALEEAAGSESVHRHKSHKKKKPKKAKKSKKSSREH